jgi:hypothetical protein
MSKEASMLKTVHVTSGDWRTLEWFLNAGGTLFISHPIGAEIKVRYGLGWLGKDRQKQRLDGTIKKLQVGGWSVTRARMQIKVRSSIDVTYDVYPGNSTINFPEQEF